ncbi:probable 2-ketogluconate reductase [Lineus longissimus]|uniref:probable 2-ketogluconate reductase n=1 Tax=Lineus longissimus TaxID=88925 RepID=UPI002B4F11D8
MDEKLRVVIEDDDLPMGAPRIQECIQLLRDKHGFDVVTFKQVYRTPDVGKTVIGAIVLYRGSDIRPIYTGKDLHLLPHLKFVGTMGIGVDHLDVRALAVAGVAVGNTPVVVGDGPADLAFALMLASARNFKQGFELMKKDFDPVKDRDISLQFGVNVVNATIGIIGLGNIGFRVAKRARGFDMKILYNDLYRRTPEDEAAMGVTFVPNLHDMLGQADFVVVCCPCTPQTEKLIGKKEFDAMKSTTTFVNVARGKIVDTDALVDAIRHSKIRAAAVDVTDPEPLPRDHPLLYFPNVIVLPHRGGATFKTMHDMLDILADSIKKISRGEPITNRVP